MICRDMSKMAVLELWQPLVEATRDRAIWIHDLLKPIFDEHKGRKMQKRRNKRKGQEMQEPSNKKGKVEITEDSKLKSEELAFSEGIWEHLVNQDGDVRILGEITVLLGFCNQLKREDWNTFEAYNAVMVALGALMQAFTKQQSVSMWKRQMEGRR